MRKSSFLSFTTIIKTPALRLFTSWIVLLLGLIVWTTVQSYLVYGPLTQRNQLPEADDSLAYLTRTQVMQECPSHDCKALSDLKDQLNDLTSGAEVQRQSEIASFAFPFYHPLFSATILSVNYFTNDLIAAYRILWSLSPLLWGIAFACFLSSLWGRTVAGITLFFLAFKVFPGPGIHYFTPSNLAIIIALFLWARILSKNGSAPIALILGSIIMLATHPIGILLSLIAIILVLTLSKKRKQDLLYIVCFFSIIACASFFLSISLGENFLNYLAVTPAHILTSLKETLNTIVTNLLEIAIQLTRYKVALFGPLIVLIPASLIGFSCLEEMQKKKIMTILIILFLFLLGSLLHSHALTPNASLFFRLFIPFAVVLFAALPHLIYVMATNVLNLLKRTPQKLTGIHSHFSAVIILALLSGYMLETIVPGMIHIQIVREHMIKRQPLSFSKSQAQLLQSKATPQDSVLYTSTMLMASYFINNSLQLGAVYYHPAFADSETTSLRLRKKNVRFAVAYNPGVYHPTYAGLDEKNRCISSPELTFSPLSKPRNAAPINQEGSIPVKNFHWIEVHPAKNANLEEINIFFNNPGKEKALELIYHTEDSSPINFSAVKQVIPATWSGWLTFPIPRTTQGDSYRFILPTGNSNTTIGGISFNNTHYWPWSHNATMVLQGKDAATGRVQLSFKPSDLLPVELKNRSISVIHDQGSSVLLEFTN